MYLHGESEEGGNLGTCVCSKLAQVLVSVCSGSLLSYSAHGNGCCNPCPSWVLSCFTFLSWVNHCIAAQVDLGALGVCSSCERTVTRLYCCSPLLLKGLQGSHLLLPSPTNLLLKGLQGPHLLHTTQSYYSSNPFLLLAMLRGERKQYGGNGGNPAALEVELGEVLQWGPKIFTPTSIVSFVGLASRGSGSSLLLWGFPRWQFSPPVEGVELLKEGRSTRT